MKPEQIEDMDSRPVKGFAIRPQTIVNMLKAGEHPAYRVSDAGIPIDAIFLQTDFDLVTGEILLVVETENGQLRGATSLLTFPRFLIEAGDNSACEENTRLAAELEEVRRVRRTLQAEYCAYKQGVTDANHK